MARPSTSTDLVRKYAAGRTGTVIDLQLDRAAVEQLAAQQGLRSFNLDSTLKRMAAREQAKVLQRGRWVVAPRGEEMPPLEFEYQPLAAELVLRRLEMPYYLSWHTALWHYGLLDQQSRRVYAAVTRRKRQVSLDRATVQFVQVTQRKFFGRVRTDEYGSPIWIATAEKAIIDSFDRPALAAPLPLVAHAMSRGVAMGEINPEQLVDDAVQFASPMLNRRLGYFMQLLDIPGSAPLLAHLGRKHAAPLVPGATPKAGTKVDPTWRVYEDQAVAEAALSPK